MYKKIVIGIAAVMLLVMTGCTSKTEEGTALLNEGDFAGASEQYLDAIEEGKELAESYRGLGICYFEQEQYKEALDAFEQALNEGTEATATLYNLCGVSALKMEHAERALFYFEEGQQFTDVSEELKKEMAFNVIVCYEMLDEYGLAKTAVEEYLSQYPDDERALKEQEFLSTQS